MQWLVIYFYNFESDSGNVAFASSLLSADSFNHYFVMLVDEFLREISFESPEEAKQEVIQSLRSVCAKSQFKTIHHVYYAGTFEALDNLLGEISRQFNTKVEKKELPDVRLALQSDNNFFHLNLLKN